MLTAYDGVALSYDAIGNLTDDGIWDYTWEHGRELASMSNGTTTWTYTYDVNGMRTSRTNSTTTYTYVYNGSNLTQMTVGNDTLYFVYDAAGTPVVVVWNGTPYNYVTTLQGDVQLIMTLDGEIAVSYDYDAWGNIVQTGGTLADTLGVLNPLRYRGYVYDTETGLYYLQTRYYNPKWGRFINADVFVSTGQGLLGNNMFAYCRNNPVNRIDISGTYDLDATDGDDDGDLNEDIGFLPGGNVNSNSASNANSSAPNSPSSNSQNAANSSPTGYSYSAPRGGGGVSSQIQVGGITVTFGHGGRHMDFPDISGLENAIAHDVVNKPHPPGYYDACDITYRGSCFTYRYFVRDPALINVGTYFYKRGN